MSASRWLSLFTLLVLLPTSALKAQSEPLPQLPAEITALFPKSVRAGNVSVRSEHLTAVAHAGTATSLLHMRMGQVTALRELLAFEFKLTPSQPEGMYFLLFGAALQREAPRALAQYMKSARAALLPAESGNREFLHEATHLSVAQLQPHTWRSFWLEEGLAELCSDAPWHQGRFTLDSRPRFPQRFENHAASWRGDAAAPTALTLLELLDSAEPTRDAWLSSDPNRAHLFMAQSHALLQFLRHVELNGQVRIVADNSVLRRLLAIEGRAANALHGRDALREALGSQWSLATATDSYAAWLRWCAAQKDNGHQHAEQMFLRGPLSIEAP
ncbi:MAG: hypothetical protein EXS14_03340 [Planctomycetes bacterium]|nr:hypothetical protein [Planctomycetota bacterium]